MKKEERHKVFKSQFAGHRKGSEASHMFQIPVQIPKFYRVAEIVRPSHNPNHACVGRQILKLSVVIGLSLVA